jgi:hypothetical protein
LFGINMLAAAAELNLLQRTGTAALQARVFKRLTKRLSGARHWREAGVESGMSYETFRARIAPCTYAQLTPAIARMGRGERDVLWPGRCSLFALTPGNASSERKYLPVTDAMLTHLRHAELESQLYYTVRTRHAAVFKGRHLSLGGLTPLTPIPGVETKSAYAGDLSAITAASLAPWAEKHLFEPGAAIVQMSDWEKKLEAIVARTRDRDLTLLSGLPNAMLQLAAAVLADAASNGRRLAHLQECWPNLECFMHTGIPVGPYYDELRAVLGPKVNFHEVYAAAEGFIAVQDAHHRDGLRVLSNAGLFFEFIPLAHYDERRIEQLGPSAVPLSDVKPGVDYAMLVTNPAGLARYALGDVVRFVSSTPPRLLYVGRTALGLNAFAENVNEKQLTDSLVTVCNRQDWRIVNFHVAPLFNGMRAGGRHEWWLELRPGTVATPTGPQIALGIDAELQRHSAEYQAKRRAGVLEAPFVRLVMPGVFEHWLTYQGKWGGQHKLQRCRSDRLIADELAQITNFARD